MSENRITVPWQFSSIEDADLAFLLLIGCHVCGKRLVDANETELHTREGVTIECLQQGYKTYCTPCGDLIA